MPQVPLAHEQVKQMLLQRIGQQWKAGHRIPTITELAEQLGTGQRNTYRALAELAAEGVVVSRRGKGTFVNPDLGKVLAERHGTRPLTGRRIVIAVLLSRHDPAIEDMLNAAEQALVEAGAVCQRVRIAAGWKFIDESFAQYDGAIAYNPGPLRTLQLHARPSWLILSTTPSLTIAAAGNYDLVSVDESQGGFLAGEALRRAGCKKICFVGVADRGGYQNLSPTCHARLLGFEAGFGQRIAREQQVIMGSYDQGSGARAFAIYNQLRPRPDGVFCTCDDTAIGFTLGAMAQHQEPGRDFKLVGFDGQHGARSMVECPPISSAAAPFEEMGRAGADFLIKRLAQPDRPAQRLLLSCTFFAGATARP